MTATDILIVKLRERLVKQSHQVFVLGVLVLIFFIYALFVLKFPVAYIWATYEDLPGEWIQTAFFVMGFALSLRLVFIRSPFRWFFALLAGACLYTVMEEISWGQRLIGFDSPDFFKQHNLQSETNLHNILSGPFASTLKDAMRYLLASALLVYGLVYPLTLRWELRNAHRVFRLGIAAPPLYLAPAFIVAAFLELERFHFNEAEIAELLVGFALAVMTMHYTFVLRRGYEILDSRIWPRGASLGLSVRLYILVTAVLMGATVVSLSLQSSPSRSAKIEKRIENGIKKFAKRYAHYENWDQSITLYRRLLIENPKNTYLMRQLAVNYGRAGDCRLYREYLNKALQREHKRYQVKPSSSRINRSLSRTYRLLGNSVKADHFAQRAINLGERRVERQPDDAYAAYSLGMSYGLVGQRDEALAEFERAYNHEPLSKHYRKAWLQQKRLVESPAMAGSKVVEGCLATNDIRD